MQENTQELIANSWARFQETCKEIARTYVIVRGQVLFRDEKKRNRVLRTKRNKTRIVLWR